MENRLESPIWPFMASAIFNSIYNKSWNNIDNEEERRFKISAGIKLNIITSIASVIEGSTKTYLKNKIIRAYYGSNLMGDVKKEGSNPNQNNKIEFHPLEEKIRYRENNEKFIIELLNRFSTKVKCPIKSQQCQLKPHKNKIRLIKLKRPIKIEKELTEILNFIDKSTWNNLKGQFKDVTSRKLSGILKMNGEKDLFKDLDLIFKFRNFIIHSNDIKLYQEKTNVGFKDRALDLFNEMDGRDLLIESSTTGKYFIEELATDKLVIHFKECLKKFLNHKFLNDEPSFKSIILNIYFS